MPTAPADHLAGLCRPIPLAAIRTDDGSQARARIRPAVVREYAAAMSRQLAEGSLCFPPVVLFTEGRDYWLGDGFHRVLAARQAGLSDILAEVHAGTRRDALLYSISSNSDHGLPRTNGDKHRAVTLLLTDAEWSQWSDGEIARRCQVSQAFASKLRKLLKLGKGASHNGYEMRCRKARRGNQVYEMQVPQPSVQANESSGETEPETGPAHASAESAVDGLGLPVPPEMADIFASLTDFRAAKELYTQLTALIDRLARQPGGGVLRSQLGRKAENGQERFVCPELEASCQKLLAAAPYGSHCPLCYLAHPGFNHPDCKLCRGQGWTTQVAFESCPANYRREMLRALGVGQLELVA